MTLSFFLEGWRDWRRWTPGPVRERQCRRGNCEARGRGCRLLSSLQLQPTAHLPSAAVRFQFSDLTLCQTKHPPAARLQFAVHHGGIKQHHATEEEKHVRWEGKGVKSRKHQRLSGGRLQNKPQCSVGVT